MGCGAGVLSAGGKAVGGALTGDIPMMLEGVMEAGEVLVEHVGDFWSLASQAAEAGGQVMGAGGAALGEGGLDALATAGEMMGAIPEVLVNVDPFALYVSVEVLAAMCHERQGSGLFQKTGESHYEPIDLSEEPDPMGAPSTSRRSQTRWEATSAEVVASAESSVEEGSAIERSCRPLGLEKAAQQARKAVEPMEMESLTVDEASAIHLYTGNVLYRKLNTDLRDGDRRKARPYFAYLRLLLGGFDKLSDAQWKNTEVMSRELFRGAEGDLSEQYPEGATVTWWAVSSCTPDLAVATGFVGASGDGGTLFRITTQTAVSIEELSAFRGEKEVLLAPGTRLRVNKVVKGNAPFAAEVHLTELPGDRFVSVVVKKSIPETWKNSNTNGHFDQMIEVVPADPAIGQAKREVFQTILDLSWKQVATRDRPCPRNSCKQQPGGCSCVQPGGDPGMPMGLQVHRILRFEDSKMWSRYMTRVVEIQERRNGNVEVPLTNSLKQAAAWEQLVNERHLLSRQSTRGLTVGAFMPLDADVNEVYLFHGTTAAAATAISEDGFLLSKAGSNVGTMYGAGVYLAECCSKADEYAKADEDAIFRLLMCRACLGRPHVTEKRDEQAGDYFLSREADSTLGDREKSTGTYREFVVYDTAQAYPEFVVEYKRLGQFYEAPTARE